MVARFGGDEFAIILPDQTNPATAERIADRIAGSLEMPYQVEGHVAAVTASIGIAFANPGHRSAAGLLRDADVALYRAKRTGKARYAVFDANVDQDARQKVALEVELRRAVAEQEFFLVFQPQIALATGHLAGVEALQRWRHPTRGILSPNAFIPLAEESDMILPIGRWVLAEACCRGQEWRQRHDTATTISVNLSARQFQDPGMVDDVAAALASSGLDPSGLKLELTESTMITEASDVDILARLKALGVQIAIDDFGTGYSSLDYLRRFPIDELKIDRAFVAGLGRDGGDTTIVRAVVGLAHALGLVVVAEGVETSGQLRRLRELGCELGQGFFLGRPLPAADIGPLLSRRSGQPTSREPVVLFAPAPRSEAIGP